MHLSKAVSRTLLSSMLMWSLSLSVASPATAGCRSCDPFFRCVPTAPGALLCMEGPGACAMSIPCYGGGNRLPDGPGEDITTWTLFDAGPLDGTARPALRAGAGAVALGEDVRVSGAAGTGALADATLAYGRDYSVALVDASGEGFALRRSVEGTGVRIEVRGVLNEIPGAVLADELLGERDQLRVPVRVEGRDRILVLQATTLRGGLVPLEIARLRRGLAAAGRANPGRREPLLRAIAR